MKKLIKKIGIISATTIATLSSTIGITTTAHAKVDLPEIIEKRTETLINGNDNKGDNPNGKLSKWTILYSVNIRKQSGLDGVKEKKYIAPTVIKFLTGGKKTLKVYDYYKNDINTKNYRPSVMTEVQHNPEKSTIISWLQAREYIYPASLYFTKTPNYTVKVYGKDYTEKNPVDLNNMVTKKWIDNNIYDAFNAGSIDEKSYEAYGSLLKNGFTDNRGLPYYKEACDVIDYILNIGNYDIDKPNHKRGWDMNSSSYFKTNTSNTRFEYDEKNAYKIAGEEERIVNEKSTLTCLSADVLNQIKTILTKNGYWWETIDKYSRIYIKTAKKTEIKNLLNANGITKFSIGI